MHSEAQKRYSTTEQELLAIISAIEHFKIYLRGASFLLRTDHQALIYLWKSKDKNGRLFRWALDLQEYDFELEHIKGKENFSDILSRAFICTAISKKEKRNETKIFIENKEERRELINKWHYETGHGSVGAVKYHICRRYEWKGMNSMINEEVQKCGTCQKEKGIKTPRSITPCSVLRPHERWEIDLVGPMHDGRYILTVIDVFTRKGNARAIKNKTSNHVINALEDVLVKEINPKEILADNGKEFISNEFKVWCENRNIRLKHGSPYTPTTTGAIERFNQTLIGKLRKLSLFGEIPWKEVLQLAVEGYNISPSRALGISPVELHEGLNRSAKEYEEILKRVRVNMQRYRKQYEKLGTTKVNNKFKKGDEVLFKLGNQPTGKLEAKWPFKGIVEETRFKSAKVRTLNGKSVIVHEGNIKPWKGN